MSEFLRVERAGAVATIWIDRQAKMNTMTVAMRNEFPAIFAGLEWFVAHAKLGKAMRATFQDRETAERRRSSCLVPCSCRRPISHPARTRRRWASTSEPRRRRSVFWCEAKASPVRRRIPW